VSPSDPIHVVLEVDAGEALARLSAVSRLPARDLALAVLVAGGGLALLVWVVPTAPLTGDGEHYVAFARSHLQHGAASAWHARRVLGPFIVSSLPLDPLLGFHALTLGSLFVTALLTWAAARHLGVGRELALASIVLFLGTWAVAPNLREYALVDPLAWTFVAAIWLATAQQRWWLAAALGVVGVLAKEVVAIAAVAAATAAWSPAGGLRRSVLSAGVVAVPSLGMVIALTLIIPGSGTDAFAYLTKWWADGLGSLGPIRVLYLIFASYGALWLLIPRGFGGLPTHLRRATLVYICAAVALPAVGSPERMEELIFPAVVATAVMATHDRGAGFMFGLALANLLFVVRVGGDAQLPSAVAWLGLLVALALAAWCLVRPGYRELSAQPAA
jgi:hypothetical protein